MRALSGRGGQSCVPSPHNEVRTQDLRMGLELESVFKEVTRVGPNAIRLVSLEGDRGTDMHRRKNTRRSQPSTRRERPQKRPTLLSP